MTRNTNKDRTNVIEPDRFIANDSRDGMRIGRAFVRFLEDMAERRRRARAARDINTVNAYLLRDVGLRRIGPGIATSVNDAA